MYDITPTFKSNKLKKCNSIEDYNLYKAALEWNLIDPIIIQKEEDLKSRQDWKDLVEPYSHQVTNLITFCRRLPVTLLSDDVGLGKTISAGLIASELMARGRVSKILVVCPKLLMPQWQEELISKFNIESVCAVGQELIEARPPKNYGAVITTYHSARIYLRVLSRAGFEMLILDEAHKLRNLYGVAKPPEVAIQFMNALKERLFKYVLMLTATPIQNRLWDIYSLVELLTVARGHVNPFGTEGMFVRNYIEDSRSEARRLQPESIDKFRSVVYGYMSRIRRKDVSLLFPERHVLLHKVEPKREELEILEEISEPIQKLNRLVQISILQALVSSPHALAAQLDNSAKKGTIPKDVAVRVRNIVKRIKTTAKQEGLLELINRLKNEQGNNWRVVVFTERRETQSTIESYLGECGIKCGLINGDSSFRNQDTIIKFRKNPPEYHVIISTRAGSEGVNLQAANVLVNYDLPWNPMIVEQRIGRIQRLASEHKYVSIFNIILQDTFEEYIVGRLMEKLQMASSAIGDIEALLEAAGMDDDDDSKGFEEKIRELVIASLAGQDVEKATKLAEESIIEAKAKLKEEEENINSMLGGSNNAIDLGPKSPDLPEIHRSIPAKEFAIIALKSRGAKILKNEKDIYTVEFEGKKEDIKFEKDSGNIESTLCRPGSPFFDKLISRITALPLHNVNDLDKDIMKAIERMSLDWVDNFNGKFIDAEIEEFRFKYEGTIVVNVRITNVHDSYERLLDLKYNSFGSFEIDTQLLEPIDKYFDDTSLLGISEEKIKKMIFDDKGVSEFCRFYIERLEDELSAAGDSEVKMKKLKEDFTPNIEITIVGLEGIVFRYINANIVYEIDSYKYESPLILVPNSERIHKEPRFLECEITNDKYPENCIEKCSISGKNALIHKLVKSEESGKYAFPEYEVTCSMSGMKVLIDEVKKSDETGKFVLSKLLKTSDISGKMAEPMFFEKCNFTGVNLLKSELKISQISGKLYRHDEELVSSISGKTGHRSEFIFCYITKEPILEKESEKCQVTGKMVKPGILEKCTVSNKKVLPELMGKSSLSNRKALKEYLIKCHITHEPILEIESEKCEITGNKVKPGILEKCSVSNKNVLAEFLDKSSLSNRKALKEYFVESSISGIKMLEEESVKSHKSSYCSTDETKLCNWTGNNYHPDDLKNCHLTRLNFYYKFINNKNYLVSLNELLEGLNHSDSRTDIWKDIEQKVIKVTENNKHNLINAQLSPNEKFLACCSISKNLMGLKVRFSGFIYSIDDNNIIGKICVGKRNKNEWIEDD